MFSKTLCWTLCALSEMDYSFFKISELRKGMNHAATEDKSIQKHGIDFDFRMFDTGLITAENSQIHLVRTIYFLYRE